MALPDQATIRPILLQVLAELGGRARPAALYPLVTARFPDIQPEDLAAVLQDGRTNRWRNRIQWVRQDLVLAGVIDAAERGVWQLTARGHDLARRGATPQDLAPPATASRRLATVPAGTAAERPAPADVPVAPLAPVPPVVSILQPTSESLAQELQRAGSDSKDPNRLERAVAEVFRFLGFAAEWIGGAGKTDVLLSAPLGIRRYSVVVDAKSTARAKVADSQVDWLAIRTHREQEHAQYACVVGTGFAGGQLYVRAQEFQVALLTTDALAEVVRLHGEMPLTLSELKALFLAVPLATEAVPQLRAAARERRRKRLLIERLLTHIDNFNQAQPDIVLAKPETLLASILAERNIDLLGTTLEDVRRTLLLLETTGVISAANGDGYVSETSIAGAHQLLAAFATAGETESATATPVKTTRPS
jgi:type III secretion system FlhB-like substrate exporter